MDKLLTTKDVQEMLNISTASVNRLIFSGRLPSYKIGGCRRFKQKEVESYINSCFDEQNIICISKKRGRPPKKQFGT